MKQGGPFKVDGGFTIVETLIVLAVTSALFVSAAALINGRQNRTLFMTSVNNLQQEFQQVINETESGYYAHAANFSCTKNDVTGPAITGLGTAAQGTNGQCIFIGKALYFGPATPSGTYVVFPLAANRQNSAAVNVKNLAEALPVAIAPGTVDNPSAPDLSVTNKLNAGLTYVWGNVSTSTTSFVLAVLHELDTNSGGGTTGSGTSGFGLYGFSGGPNWQASNLPSSNLHNVAQSIHDDSAGGQIFKLDRAVDFCIASGTTDQSGLFTIDDSLHVKLVIKSGQVCA